MKLNTAFNILLAVICTVSRAHARVPSRLRDPRTVEEKEQVHRQTMGDHVLGSLLIQDADGSSCGDRLVVKEKELLAMNYSPEKTKSLACTSVSTDFPVCQGCQGFSQVDREVHIPGCVGMTYQGCTELATEIVLEKPDWFKDGADTQLDPEMLSVLPSEMAYYKLGLPVSADDGATQGSKVIMGVAGDCMVHYPWDWCVDIEGSTACLKLPPWDCSRGADGGCLSSSECCAQIQGEYPGQDINGNELLCYEWVLPVKSSVNSGGNTSTGSLTDSTSSIVSSGGVTGNRLIIHLNADNVVAVPAVITDGNYEPVHDEEIIEVGNECFPNDLGKWDRKPVTLKAAVLAYVIQNCATTPDCEIGVEWGWPINSWCVEKVTSFKELFKGLTTFNEDVNGWTTSQVTNMQAAFHGASAFNQPLNNWETSSVTNMQYAFNRLKAFNQPLNNWDVSSVTLMAQLFYETDAFNQPLDNWKVSKVTSMYGMFWKAYAFNQPLDNWDVSSSTNMGLMFRDATAFNQNLCHFGDHFKSWPDKKYNNMFFLSDCSNTENDGTPTSDNGPWCQAC